MNVTSRETRAVIIESLLAGASIRQTATMVGVEKKTVRALVASLGGRGALRELATTRPVAEIVADSYEPWLR